MSILVTGGNGLIGANIVRILAEVHDDEVVIVDASPDLAEHSVLTEVADKVKYVQGSVTDLALLLRTIKDHGVTEAVHGAAIIAGAAARRPSEALEVNILGTVNMLEAARIVGLRRVVALSSSAVMGDPEDLNTPRREDDIMLPAVGIYPISKLTCELLVNTYRSLYDVDAAIVRPRSVYGPGRWSVHHPMPVPQVIHAVQRGEDVIRPSGSDTKFDLTYVKDEANGIISLLKFDKALPHAVYNISAGRNVSMGEVFEVLRGLRPDVTIEVGPGLWEGVLPTGRQRDASYHSSQRPPQDVSRIREDIGFAPTWPVERAVPDYLTWLDGGVYGSAA